MDPIVETKTLTSALTGKTFDPDDGYVTDAEGNKYRLGEYSIEKDKATDGDGNLPDAVDAE